MTNKKGLRGFTLIELLVVISIIGLLSSVVLASVTDVRAKARDARRKSDLNQLAKALEVRYNDTASSYPISAGGFQNAGHGGLDAILVPGYFPVVPDDPLNAGSYYYQYWRKDYMHVSVPCFTGGSIGKFGFYARLEKPSSSDTATIVDDFDRCVRDTWSLNYKSGN